MGRKVTKLPKEIAHDLAHLTNREFCAKYGWKPSQAANARTRHGIRMMPATVARALEDRRRAQTGDPGFTKEMARTMTAAEIAAVAGLGVGQVESRIHNQGWTKREINPKPAAERDMIQALEDAGYQVTKPLPHQPIIEIAGKPGEHYRAAVVCCTHIGNVFQQLTHLKDFYRYAEAAGIEEFWHAGDATDGPDSMHPAMRHEHWRHTFDHAVDAFCDLYPKPKHGLTRLILGNHDEAWLKDASGSDIGRAIAARRQDIQYVGRRAADIRVGNTRIYILHGAGPGAYARSYRLQKTIESFRPDNRPDVLLLGNWHMPAHLPAYIGVEGFMLPSFEDTTPFITSIAKESVIGGLIFDIELGQKGIRDVRVQWRLYGTALKGDHPK